MSRLDNSKRQTLRIGVLSDFHGDHKREAFDYFCRQAAPDMILCAGDQQDYKPFPLPYKFIRGNHEDWETIAALASGKLVVPNLEYLPDGRRLNLGGVSVLGIGGNWSPTGRVAPKYIDPGYLANLRDQRADIVLSHETPIHFADGHLSRTLEPLRELCARLSPRLWFSGHHHFYEVERLGRTEIVSLGKWPHEWVVLDIDRGDLAWSRWAPVDKGDYLARLPAWTAAEAAQKDLLLGAERRSKRR